MDSLKIAASADPCFKKFFLDSEVLLLEYRLECSPGGLCYNISKLLTELQRSRVALRAWSDRGADFEAACSVAEDVLQFTCIDEDVCCGKCSVRVSWEQVPGLVAARAVCVERGMCSLSCHDTTRLLSELYLRLLSAGVRDMSQHCQMYSLQIIHSALHDSLRKTVTSFMSLHQLSSSHVALSTRTAPLKAREVLTVAKLFPPCFAQLHHSLTKHRRLPHHQRYRYSVFLKRIGLPLEENITFWQDHYMAAAHEHSTCGHHWSRDSARYIYSLRHLYGLEGRRRPAVPHSCRQLQVLVCAGVLVQWLLLDCWCSGCFWTSMSAQPGDCGGCPFAVAASMASPSSEGPGAVVAHSCSSELPSHSVVLREASCSVIQSTQRLVSSASDENSSKSGLGLQSGNRQNNDMLHLTRGASENTPRIGRSDASVRFINKKCGPTQTSVFSIGVGKPNFQSPKSKGSENVNPVLGSVPTDTFSEDIAEIQGTHRDAKHLQEFGVDPLPEKDRLCLTPIRSRSLVNMKTQKLIQCDSFSMNDLVEAGPDSQCTLLEIPNKNFSCEKREPSAVSSTCSAEKEYRFEFPSKFEDSSGVKANLKTLNDSPLEAEVSKASIEEKITGLCSRKQSLDGKRSSFPSFEEGSHSIRNTDESKVSSPISHSLPTFPSSTFPSCSVSVHSPSISFPHLVPHTSHSFSLDPVSSTIFSTSHLVFVSSSLRSTTSSSSVCSIAPSWSTTSRPIPSPSTSCCSSSSTSLYSCASSKAPTSLPPESVMLSPRSASLDRVLRVCGVRSPSVRKAVIRVACDGRASFACRLTLAALLDQAASDTPVTETAVNNGENGRVLTDDCERLNEEKLNDGINSMEVLRDEKLATVSCVDRVIEDIPFREENVEKSIRGCCDLTEKRKLTPDDIEQVHMSASKKINQEYVENSSAVEQNGDSNWVSNIELGRVHIKKENFQTASESETYSNISNPGSNRDDQNVSLTHFSESKLKKSSIHHHFMGKFDPQKKVCDSHENDCAANICANKIISVSGKKASSWLSRKKSVARSPDLNFQEEGVPSENNSFFVTRPVNQIGNESFEDDVTQQNYAMDSEDISIVWMNLNKSRFKTSSTSLNSFKSLSKDSEYQDRALVDSTEADSNSMSPVSSGMFCSSASSTTPSGRAVCGVTPKNNDPSSQANADPETFDCATHAEHVRNVKVSNHSTSGSTESVEFCSLGVVTNPPTSAVPKYPGNQRSGSSHFVQNMLEVSSPMKISSVHSFVSKSLAKVSKIRLNPVNLVSTEKSLIKRPEHEPLLKFKSRQLEKTNYSGPLQMCSKDKIRKLLCRTQSFCEPAPQMNVTFGCKKQSNSFGANKISKKSKRSSSSCASRTNVQRAAEDKLQNLERSASNLLSGPKAGASNTNGVFSSTSVTSDAEKNANSSASLFLNREKDLISSFRSPFQENGVISRSLSSSTKDNKSFTPHELSTEDDDQFRNSSRLLSENRTEINADPYKQRISVLSETKVTKSPSISSENIENLTSTSKRKVCTKSFIHSASSLDPKIYLASVIDTVSSPSKAGSYRKYINGNTPSTPKSEMCGYSNINTSACVPAVRHEPAVTPSLYCSDSRVAKDADNAVLAPGFTDSWMRRALNPVDVGLNFSTPHQYYQLLKSGSRVVTKKSSSD
ncbi:DNA primase large subunit eukaryotic/archaeal [Trinorchestia longiramus]|nr:DNA primase large subunit eukaryotic/archaeal [Trinorchestia longiramus]